ncbi:glyoxalase superfamily protein [uncultured Pseudomonas sp.]|uniref:glyoxalase superfamily protein n=1 Tax=uncultured Pseudomonas sp. TaxID=114707 RepID=UPI0025ECBF35|nr:glyoxalase superfamily protein [uncultured Pseudomonas sp.]
MITLEQAKHMAKALRTHLPGAELSHSAALELVARQLGYKDWNVAAARLPSERPRPAVSFQRCIPILRSFDEAKAREFYLDFLGFGIEFEHRFEPGLPLYLGIVRDGLQLHLSEHHGDASPGATLFIPLQGVEALRDELHGKQYGYGRPQIVEQPWGRLLEVHDPFGNRLRFCED